MQDVQMFLSAGDKAGIAAAALLLLYIIFIMRYKGVKK